MIEVKIEISLDELRKLVESQPAVNMSEAALPNTASAFEQAASYVRNMWTNFLMGETDLAGLETPDGITSAMVKSIRQSHIGDFEHKVFSEDKNLRKLTEGTPDVIFDMKKTHPYGRKSRMSKKGVPYLIIPFRWGTPNGKGSKRAHFNNVIPQYEYRTAVKALKLSTVKDITHPELNAKGQAIDRAEYNWGSRLTKDTAWDDRSVGMVKMKNMGKSTYFTFRIISAKSPADSWWYRKKGQPSIDMMNKLVQATEKGVTKIIESGIKEDEKMYNN